MDEKLTALRIEIDGLDDQIIELIGRRQRCVERAGVIKRGRPVTEVKAPARVEEVIARARRTANVKGASSDLVAAVYRTMIDQFILLETMTHAASHGARDPERRCDPDFLVTNGISRCDARHPFDGFRVRL